MADNLTFIVALIGFFGGIAGGILVNTVSHYLNKQADKREAADEARRIYKAGLLGLLNEIITIWDAENASGLNPKPIKNKFDIIRQQISKEISNPPVPLRPEINAEFQELIVALNKVRDTPIMAGMNDYLRTKCNPVLEKVKHIKALDTEWFEAK